MMSRLNVTVLMGGPDAEREVSIASGKAVTEALQKNDRFDVQSLVIDTPTLEDIDSIRSDIIFPVLHGPFGEGGPLQKLLEKSGKLFVGSSSETAATAMDKVQTKEIARKLGIQTPEWCIINRESNETIPIPFVLKPINDGSSVDVQICQTQREADIHIERLLDQRDELLAESFVQGAEVTVGIVSGRALPIIEIIPPTDIGGYDFEAKYIREDTTYILDPNLPENTCSAWALDLYHELQVRSLARVDFILNDQGAWFLELNTMPGFTNHSLLPMAAEHIGMNMYELCTTLVLEASDSRVKP